MSEKTRTTKVAVFFHRADHDGLLSGVIAEKYLTPRKDHVDLFPIDHSDSVPKKFLESKLEYDEIYMIDISIVSLFEDESINRKITLIDHHKTAIDLVKEKKYPIKMYCIEGVAACRLAFQFFTELDYSLYEKEHYVDRVVSEPILLTLLGEYDVWDHRSKHSLPLNFGIESNFESVKNILNVTMNLFCSNLTEDAIDLIVNKNIDLRMAREKGSAVLNFIKNTENRLDGGVPIMIAGHDAVAFNTHVKSSMISKAMKDDLVIVSWCVKDDPNKVSVSLYGDPRKNLHLYAKEMGGGGHPGACGFTCEAEKFLKFMQMAKRNY